MTTLRELMASVPEMATIPSYGERLRPGDELRQLGFGMMQAGGKAGSTGLGALGEAGMGVIDTEQGIVDRAMKATMSFNDGRMDRFKATAMLAQAEQEARDNAEKMVLERQKLQELDAREKMEAAMRQRALEGEEQRTAQTMRLNRDKMMQDSALARFADNRSARGQEIDLERIKQAALLADRQDQSALARLEREAELDRQKPTDMERNYSALQRMGVSPERALPLVAGEKVDRVAEREREQRELAQREMDARYGGMSERDLLDKGKDDPVLNELLRRGATPRKIRASVDEVTSELDAIMPRLAQLPPAQYAVVMAKARDRAAKFGLSPIEFDQRYGMSD